MSNKHKVRKMIQKTQQNPPASSVITNAPAPAGAGNNNPIGLPPEDLLKLGIPQDAFYEGFQEAELLSDIVAYDPFMVSAFIGQDAQIQLMGRPLKLPKGRNYIMPLGLYTNIYHNVIRSGEHTSQFRPSTIPFKQRFKRYRGEDLTNKKLLVWRFGGFGDIMFAQPLIKYLKDKYPTCKIIFASSPACSELFYCWPKGLIDNVSIIPFDSDLMDHVDYHMTFEGAIERCREARQLDAMEVFKRVANVEFDIDKYPVELVPVSDVSLKLYPYIPEDTVAIQIRSTSPARSFPMPKLRLLVEKLVDQGYTVGFWDSIDAFMHLDDYMMGQFFARPDKVINLARFSRDIVHGVSILSHCKGLIGVDSAGVHLSAALSKPTVSINGPIQSKLRVSHYPTAVGIDTPENWDECLRYPCFAHNATLALCPYLQKQQFVGCMDSIEIDTIVNAFIEIDKKVNNAQ